MPSANTLSPGAVKLLMEPQLAHLATVMPNGSPQVTPVWVDVEPDGSQVLVNTSDGRIKANNTRSNPEVALSIVDSQNPWRLVTIRGTVVEQSREGAEEHIDKLAKKYIGADRYPWHNPDEPRVILRIQPHHVMEQGVDEGS